MIQFLTDVSAELTAIASRATSSEYGFVPLAAHLFAAAVYLRERHGSARMDSLEPEEIASDIRDALSLSRRIPTNSYSEAYLSMRAALQGIDAELLGNRVAHIELLPKVTTLHPVSDVTERGLFGEVDHWIRPHSNWISARKDRFAAAPHVHYYPPTPADELRALGMQWSRGEVPATTPMRARDLLVSSESFRVALCPLPGVATPCFAISADGALFSIDRTQPMLDSRALALHLDELCSELGERAVDLVVFPELSIDLAARAQLQSLIARSESLKGVIAGSFHIWPNELDDEPLNESVLHDATRVALTHHKRGYFRITDKQVRQFERLFSKPIPPLKPRIVEGIRRGSSLQFCDTRIGRLAVLICADAIAREGFAAALDRCHPDILFMPSLSLRTDDFERSTEILARKGVSTMYVNAGCVKGHGDNVAALVSIALPELPGSPPTRVRWKFGELPECWDFRTKNWVNANHPSIQVLSGDRALLVDIESHWSFRPADRNGPLLVTRSDDKIIELKGRST